jgi:very-short-patch-repair endonuclease
LYDYSKTDYRGVTAKVTIICSKHGEFLQKANNHLNGQGCPFCHRRQNLKSTWRDEIKKVIDAEQHHYILLDTPFLWKGAKTRIKLLCKDCNNEFEVAVDNFLNNGQRCTYCTKRKVSDKSRKTVDQFIKDARKVHGNLYNYSQVHYEGSTRKVNIVCQEHGTFFQKASSHLQGSVCPLCKKVSKGEKRIASFLDNSNILYVRQNSLGCINLETNYSLRFDFYLPDYKMCVEYDGEQHFKQMKALLGEERSLKVLEDVKKRDRIKNKYCKENNINLLRINYKDYNNIEKILNKEFLGEQ